MLSTVMAVLLASSPLLPSSAPMGGPLTAGAERAGLRLLEANSLAGATGTETREKSSNVLIVAGELSFGLLGGYLGLAVGIALNFSKGGVSLPPDSTDLLLVGLLPALSAAVPAWAIGLFDLKQRSFLGSLIVGALGAVAGEGLGLLAGSLVGEILYPTDQVAAALVAIFVAPAFAAIGATVAMEVFKPGAPAGATATATASPAVAMARDVGGRWSLGPAVAMRF